MKTLIISTDFWNVLLSDFIKILSVTAELFHVDRRTDMTKLLVAFRNFAIAPTNYVCYSYFTFNSQEHAIHNKKNLTLRM